MLTLEFTDKQLERSAKLGAVTELLCSASRGTYHISSISYWVKPALLLNQLKLFFDNSGRPVGYLMWAYLSQELSDRMLMDDVNVLHLSEWNEGLNLWILDFVAPFGHASEIALYARKVMFPHHGVAHGLRRDKDDLLKRVARFSQRLDS